MLVSLSSRFSNEAARRVLQNVLGLAPGALGPALSGSPTAGSMAEIGELPADRGRSGAGQPDWGEGEAPKRRKVGR